MSFTIGFAALAVVVIVVFLACMVRLHSGISAFRQTSREFLFRLDALEDRMEQNEHSLKTSLAGLREELRTSSRDSREELARNFSALGENQSKHLGEISGLQKDALSLLAGQLLQMIRSNESKQDALRDTLETRMRELQAGNEEKLEKMRVLVDEKLHATLEQRLGSAFTNVSDWLDKVHKGLGEMKNLAGDVGDLRKVLTNVKTRGTWGEIQLGALLEQVLHRDQYEENVAVIPGAPERVEFALKLPGTVDGSCVWLPIDSKFPQEDYLRIVDASEACHAEAIVDSRKALERRVMEEAKKIRDKYVEVPYTTDFGIMFLPVEGLYCEVLRIDGLCERLMREFRVVVSGPTTIMALLNSLQMGFRTLAVEKRSSEVCLLLGQVRTEFAKFGVVLDKVQNRIEQAGKELEGAGRRTKAIERRLRSVSTLSPDGSAEESGLPVVEEDELDGEA